MPMGRMKILAMKIKLLVLVIHVGMQVSHDAVKFLLFHTPTNFNEPRYEKTRFLHMRKQRRRSALRSREADQRLCFRYMDSRIPLLPKSKFQASSHLL